MAPRSASSSASRPSSKGVRSSTSDRAWRWAASTPAAGPVDGHHMAQLDARGRPAQGAGDLDQLAGGQEVLERAGRLGGDLGPAGVADGCQLTSQVVHSSPSLSLRRFPMPRLGDPGTPDPPALAGDRLGLGLVLDRQDVAFGEEVGPQHLVDLGIVAPQPLQRHGEVLLLLVAVVGQHRGQLGVVADRHPLVVPVDGLELFHDRDDGAVTVDHVGGQPLFVQLEASGTHRCRLLPVRQPRQSASWPSGRQPAAWPSGRRASLRAPSASGCHRSSGSGLAASPSVLAFAVASRCRGQPDSAEGPVRRR